MFRGIHSVNLDTKGRLQVPARYREALHEFCGGRLVATIDTEESCLLIYPQPYWEEIQEKLEALPSFNPAARRAQRLLIGHASDLEIDASGRVLLPSALREFAGLEKKITLLGQGNKLELWSDDQWKARSQEMLKQSGDADSLPLEMQSFSL